MEGDPGSQAICLTLLDTPGKNPHEAVRNFDQEVGENIFFRLEIMVESSLADLGPLGNIVQRSGLVPLLAKYCGGQIRKIFFSLF